MKMDREKKREMHREKETEKIQAERNRQRLTASCTERIERDR